MTTFNGNTTNEEVIKAFTPQIKGKTFVIVGAGHPSIGSEIATSLAQGSPAHILLASRTAAKVEPVLSRIAALDASVKTTFVQVDTTDHGSVRRAAAEILVAAPRIDVLYTLDKQGVEMQLSANHVGDFLLTNLLVPALLVAGAEPGGARLVNLTSSGYLISPFRFDDWNFSGGKTYDPWISYGQAKTANILFAHGLHARLASRGVTSTATHPGYTPDTQLGAHLTPADYAAIAPTMKRSTGRDWAWEEPRFKTLAQIAATPLVAALDPAVPVLSPAYLWNGRVGEVEEYAWDPESVERLWRLSEELVGQRFEY
ncbi:NAD(P)-binding protein [Whalleya microplaca]|nr:NAD(P)-binding protein [Whalleya microplaca]